MTDLSILDNYPNVQRYVAEYIENERMGPGGNRLPDLVIWFRETLEKNNVDVAEYFEWEDEWRIEFYSWGSNSRWANAFRNWLSVDELEYQLEKIADIAKEYGDPNIEELYPINKGA